jgi:KDO2-lipid IV(A) lauroyltransferase
VAKNPLFRKIRDDLFYLLVVAGIGFLRLLPRRLTLGLMRTLGRLAYLVAAGPRRRAMAHLKMAYGNEKSPAEIRRLTRRVFIHFATAAADFILLPLIIERGINRLVAATGTEHLDRAFASGKGLLMITCHFGNWEILGAWLARNNYRMSVVGTTLFDPRLDRILVETRNRAGYTNIARGKGTRDIIRTLKKGEAVGMLIDQDTKTDGVFVDFFGLPAYTPTGPAVLARRLNLPIIPIFAYLKDDLTYRIECLPPLDLVKTDNEAEDILVYTRKCSEAYEAMIRRFPEQWVWMHKRWKTRPEQFAARDNG